MFHQTAERQKMLIFQSKLDTTGNFWAKHWVEFHPGLQLNESWIMIFVFYDTLTQLKTIVIIISNMIISKKYRINASLNPIGEKTFVMSLCFI